ncbi:MAG: hypothetical protein LPK21_08695, partial [Hymenobacteraceae bacterium]|nr:hypothetical protein [Hymenobacteraceae bacterium]
ENNQIDIKVIRLLGDSLHHELGASVQGGLLYNLDTKQNGTRYAGALHYEHELPESRWSVKMEAMFYRINPEYPEENKQNFVQMGAFGANYNVATKGDIYTASVGYLLPVKSRLLESVLIYNNYGYYNKGITGYENSHMNVLGALWTAGPMYIYSDAAFGYNHPWLGPEWENALSVGTPGDTDWHMRFNINMGYYF